MDKALQIGKSSTVGSFFLMIGVVASTVILALGTLVLAGLLPVEDLGLYGIVMIPSTTIGFFRDWGVNSAMTQQIASLRAAGKNAEIHDVIVSGIVFEVISGALLSLVCFVLAQPLAVILGRPESTFLISLMSVSIFASAIIAAASAIFIGFEKMKWNSFAQVFQSVIKVALGPLLVLLGYGVFGAVVGLLGSLFAGGLIGILIVYFVLFRPLNKGRVGRVDVKKTLAPMLKFGLPLTVSNILVGVLPQVFSFFMALYAGNAMMGNYYAATYFSVIITFISFPISTALFPAFAKLSPESEPELVKSVFASSVKYTAVLLVPTIMLLITLATPMINTLFPRDGIIQSLFIINAVPKFPYAPLFLMTSAVVNLLVLFGNVSLATFQTGIGKTNQIMKQSLLSLAISLPSAYVIISYLGTLPGANTEMLAIIGGIVAIFISNVPGMVWGLVWLWRNYHVKADLKSSGKVFAASLLASVLTYFSLSLLNAPYLILLIVGGVVFVVVYLITAPVIGAINRVDIDNLKAMISGLGFISKVLGVPLAFMRKICKK